MHQTIILTIGGAGGAVATYMLQKIGIPTVIASSIVGLAGALLGYIISSTQLSEVIFAGSFVGMTATSLASMPLIVFAGLGAGVLYGISLDIFSGVGGRLGAIAFIATTCVLWIAKFLPKKTD